MTLSQKRTSRMHSKNGGDGGTGVYMREGTTSRVTAADRPYGKFYDLYSVSPENFGSTLVFRNKSRNSVVSIVTILQAGGSVVRFPVGAGDFSHLPNVHTS